MTGTATVSTGRGVARIAAMLLALAPVAGTAAAAPAVGGAPAAAVQAPAVRPVARWTPATAAALLRYGETVGRHGLDPGDYALEALRAAVAGGDAGAIDRAGTVSFALIARDLANGRVRPPARRLAFYDAASLSPGAVLAMMDDALARGDPGGALERLAPRSAGYRALQAALAALPPEGEARARRAIRASLERWRWLPRDLGQRHILVNIPGYTAWLVDGGAVVSQHRVIVGKRSTPTPQFASAVQAVVLNPPWNVPQSIIAESVGALVRSRPDTARARGYVWSTAPGGALRVTQRPGPGNALGQVKLDMPNPHSVYLHDTPSKALFDRETRTLSHGCIRTERPQALAAALLSGTGWTEARIAGVTAGTETVRVPLARSVPVYIAYFTAEADADGRVRILDDPYALDAALVEAMGGETRRRALTLKETECSPARG